MVVGIDHLSLGSIPILSLAKIKKQSLSQIDQIMHKAHIEMLQPGSEGVDWNSQLLWAEQTTLVKTFRLEKYTNK